MTYFCHCVHLGLNELLELTFFDIFSDMKICFSFIKTCTPEYSRKTKIIYNSRSYCLTLPGVLWPDQSGSANSCEAGDPRFLGR